MSLARRAPILRHRWAVALAAGTCALAVALCPASAAAARRHHHHHGVTGAEVVAYAKQFIGTPFEWGATGPRAFDCSGFVQYVYARFGYRLERTSFEQMQEGRALSGGLKLGDLVFWAGGAYDGIYTGDHTFIGVTVIRGVWVSSFRVWRMTQPYATARRILAR